MKLKNLTIFEKRKISDGELISGFLSFPDSVDWYIYTKKSGKESILYYNHIDSRETKFSMINDMITEDMESLLKEGCV